METLIKADIFFFITSIAVIILAVFASIVMYYLIGALRNFRALARRLEKDIGNAGEEVEEMVERVSDSFIFSMLFPKKHRKHPKVKTEK